MPSVHQMAERTAGHLLSQMRLTGEQQASKDYGYGDRKRCAIVYGYDPGTEVYQVELLCWGFVAKQVSGTYWHMYSEIVEALGGSG